MAGTRKIQDESEVLRWFEEGRTYQWMTEEYERKYNITMTGSAWGNFRRRKGIARRITRDDDLIPWLVKREHRWNYDLAMLRAEARRRAGRPLKPHVEERLESWLRTLHEADAVVHYDPETADGFHLVKREKGDTDLIHEPKRKTTLHKAVD